MIIHLHKIWKIQNKITYSSTICYHCLDKLSFFLSFNIKLSEINRMNVQRGRLW